MVTVRIRDNESIEEALRRFKRSCEREGVVQEFKRREFHETSGMKKKRKEQEARKKRRKKRYY